MGLLLSVLLDKHHFQSCALQKNLETVKLKNVEDSHSFSIFEKPNFQNGLDDTRLL